MELESESPPAATRPRTRHLWKLIAVAATAAACWSLTAPLVQVPGMGEPLTFMETGKLQGGLIKGILILGGLAAVAGLGRLAGILGGLATGLALSVACKQWESIQELKAMNEEMKSSGTSMGDMSSMLDIRICYGSQVLGLSLLVLLLACLWAGSRQAKA